MSSQNIYLFIYNVEFEIEKTIEFIRREFEDLSFECFVEEFILHFTERKNVINYKKYLILSSIKYTIDNKLFTISNKDFKDYHLESLYKNYLDSEEEFDSLIDDDSNLTKKYISKINKSFYYNFNSEVSENSEELFDSLPRVIIR